MSDREFVHGESDVAREEAARRLRLLADQIERGELELESRSHRFGVPVPPDVHVGVGVARGGADGQEGVEIEVSWETAAV